MEYHPKALSNDGVGAQHSQQPHTVTPRDELNALDKVNAEDLILIAVDLLAEAKIYDETVLNPINYQMLVILEHAIAYFPNSERIKSWLIKAYSKLGLVTIVRQLISNYQGADELN
jgi:hypothetical protein